MGSSFQIRELGSGLQKAWPDSDGGLIPPLRGSLCFLFVLLRIRNRHELYKRCDGQDSPFPDDYRYGIAVRRADRSQQLPRGDIVGVACTQNLGHARPSCSKSRTTFIFFLRIIKREYSALRSAEFLPVRLRQADFWQSFSRDQDERAPGGQNLWLGGNVVNFSSCPFDQKTQRLSRYIATNAQLISSDSGFAAWLEKEYVPIAGGWHY